MGLIFFVLGLLVGACLMGATWSHEEAAATRRGFIKLGDRFFKLTPISLNNWEDDE